MKSTKAFHDEIVSFVETKIFDAARTDLGLPRMGPRGYASLNLPTVQNPNEAYGYTEARIPKWLRENETAENPIDEFDRVQGWLRSIEAPKSKVVWARARAEVKSSDERVTWARTAKNFSISPRHAQRLYKDGIMAIVGNMVYGKKPIPMEVRFRVYEW